jgi:hypothetical protein
MKGWIFGILLGFLVGVGLSATALHLDWVPPTWLPPTWREAQASGDAAAETKLKLRPEDPGTAAACLAEKNVASFAAYLFWFSRENPTGEVSAKEWRMEADKDLPTSDNSEAQNMRETLLGLGGLRLNDKKELEDDGTPRGKENLALVNRLYSP